MNKKDILECKFTKNIKIEINANSSSNFTTKRQKEKKKENKSEIFTFENSENIFH